MVVSVSRNDGTPVTGLTADDFGIYVVGDPQRIVTGTNEDFIELPAPPGGVYTMGTGNHPQDQWDPMVVLIAHVKTGGDEGRGMFEVGP
ncbi:MAG TPA: hypothetical protein VLK36_00310 [Gaiellaceae bacterium]|nr:hypothetical protein [Gaiellaceae bacterium]